MLTVRHIQTTQNEKGKTVPVLDANEREIVLWSVDVPHAVEAEGGEAVDAYVAAELAKPAVAPTSSTPAAVPIPDTAPAAEEPAE